MYPRNTYLWLFRIIFPYWRSGRLFALAWIVVWTAFAYEARAQDFEDALFTMGTVTTQSSEPWAYVFWQSPNLALITQETYAIYHKPVPPDDPAPFTPTAIVRTQTDPNTIRAILNRAAVFDGESDSPSVGLESFNREINLLFGNLLPENSGGGSGFESSSALPDKLSALLLAAMEDPVLAERLLSLARRHPRLAMVLGNAYAFPIASGTHTVEIRACDGAVMDPALCTVVVGRVILEEGNPVVLPAPGPVAILPPKDVHGDPSSKGHLNAHLRWGSPPELRQYNQLSLGYHLYRVTPEKAEDLGWDDPETPPLPGELAMEAEIDPESVALVSNLPVVPPREFSPAEAISPAVEPETVFVVDEGGRLEGEGEGFSDGDSFFYYAVPLDLLYREGFASPASADPIRICGQIPAAIPRNIVADTQVVFDPVTEDERVAMRVSWDANDNAIEEEVETTHYFVYRWDSTSDLYSGERDPFDPAYLISNPIPHDVDGERLFFIDDGADSPQYPGDTGKSFVYSVRAARLDPDGCNPLFSTNAHTYGVLREYRGPGGAIGNAWLVCEDPVIQYLPGSSGSFVGFPSPDPNWIEFTVSIQIDPFETAGARWVEVEFSYDGMEWIPLSNIYLTDPGTELYGFGEFRVPRLDSSPTAPDPSVRAVLVGHAGARSGPAVGSFAISPEERGTFVFGGDINYQRVVTPGPCRVHVSVVPIPGVSGRTESLPVEPVQLSFNLLPRTESWRVFRRVDDGPLQLVRQGRDSFDPANAEIFLEDVNLPLNAARLCYFAQLFDKHGNPSPIFRLEPCFHATPRIPPEAPLLAQIETEGDYFQTEAIISWTSSPAADRFLVWVATSNGAPPTDLSDDMIAVGDPQTPFPSEQSADPPMEFQAYDPGRRGAGLSEEPPFTVHLHDIEPDVMYTVRVQAICAAGTHSPSSLPRSFQWIPEIPDTGHTPWPFREEPVVVDPFHPRITPVYLDTPGEEGVGLEIGRIPAGDWLFDSDGNPVLPPSTFLSSHWHTGHGFDALCPCVLYRIQLPNALWPGDPGPLVQVSPLHDPWMVATANTADGNQMIVEPFLRLEPDGGDLRILLEDTHPVLEEARYGYFVVRFDEHGEIKEVVQLPPLDIP